MELGATVCAQAAPACARCPVARLCDGRAAGRAARAPAARVAARRACAASSRARWWSRAGRVLLVRRPARGLFAGLPAFPAAEVSPASASGPALAEDLRARHGLSAPAGARSWPGSSASSPTALLELRAYRCRLYRAPPEGAGEWAPEAAVGAAGLPAAMRALWEAVRASRADAA